MGELFNTLLYVPLLNALVLLYKHIAFEDLGVAVILLTVLVRLVFWPLFYKAMLSQAVMQKIQPEIKRIQKTHKDDKAKQAELLMGVYKAHNINPFSGLLLIGIQLPIIFALYRVFLKGFSEESLLQLYSFVPYIPEVNQQFLGVLNLSEPSIALALVAAVAQFFQSKLSLAKTQNTPNAEEAAQNPMASIGKQMVYIGPVITLVVLWNLPAVIGVYWVTTTLFGIVQQLHVNKGIEKHRFAESKQQAIPAMEKSVK